MDAAISPSKENPPARYSIFPDASFGRTSETTKSRTPAPMIKRRGMCFSSTLPSTTSLIGKRLALLTGSHAESRDTPSATAKEEIMLNGEMTTGISIPWERDCPIPRKISFKTSVPTGIPANSPITPYRALSRRRIRVTVFCVAPILRNVPITGRRSNVMT